MNEMAKSTLEAAIKIYEEGGINTDLRARNENTKLESD